MVNKIEIPKVDEVKDTWDQTIDNLVEDWFLKYKTKYEKTNQKEPEKADQTKRAFNKRLDTIFIKEIDKKSAEIILKTKFQLNKLKEEVNVGLSA